MVCNCAGADVSHKGERVRLKAEGNAAGLQLTVGGEAKHDDGEDELSDAHWEDPVDGHLDSVEILFHRVMFFDARVVDFQRCLRRDEGKANG